MKLFLVGLPGSGKSTLGKQLAQQLTLRFIDLDDAIEQHAQQPIRDIFAQRGEAYFRSLERQILRAIIEQQPSFAMATGGGTPCFSDNMKLMKQAGTTLFVDTPVSIIAERMQREGIAVRPLLQQLDGANFEQEYLKMFAYRLPYYQQAALTIAPQDTLEDVLSKIRS